jgi:hypothetical protein
VRGEDQERHGVDGHQRPRGQHRALHTLLPVEVEEGLERREVAELVLEDRRLGADGERVADLRDDDADLSRGDLHPRELLHGVDGPQPQPQPRHEELGLVAGLAVERDGVVLGELLDGEALVDQADLRRTDRVDRLQDHDQSEEHDDGDDDADRQ